VKQMYYALRSMRPEQWTKNLVVFAALIFSRNFADAALALKATEAFLVLCLLSGLIYLINDIVDADKDKLHVSKRNRPIASGRLPVSTAFVFIVVGTLLGLYLSSHVGQQFLMLAIGFLALNLVYSFLLKRIVLLDVMGISISFILRAIAGVEALRAVDPGLRLSPWLLICTLFLSLFLAFCKRRHELLTVADAANHRESLSQYSPVLLDQLVSMTAGGSVLSYAIYTIWPDTVERFGTAGLVYTIPLVMIGVMRYLYLVYNEDKGGSPSDHLLHEKFLLGVVILWIALVVAILGDF